MVAALHDVTAQAVEAYATTPRIEWVLHWPGQVVLVVTAIFWTQQMAAAITGGAAGALAAAAASNTADLNAVVELVRGELTGLQRATLSALVVMDVHARDVAAALAAEGLEGQPGHFSWLAQLRMYWVRSPGVLVHNSVHRVHSLAGVCDLLLTACVQHVRGGTWRSAHTPVLPYNDASCRRTPTRRSPRSATYPSAS